MPEQMILSGVRVHNLKSVHLSLPYEKLIVFCGRSGSGKSSLAIDTLYAEGQRRYIESFSVHARQFLEKLEKPDAERIEGVPPSIAITAKSYRHVNRSTVGTVTETADYLRLLFSKIGKLACPHCGRTIQSETPQSICGTLSRFPAGTRLMIAFVPDPDEMESDQTVFQQKWKEKGFFRVIADGKTYRLDNGGIPENLFKALTGRSSHPNREMPEISEPPVPSELWAETEEKPDDSYTFAEIAAEVPEEELEEDLQESEMKDCFDIPLEPLQKQEKHPVRQELPRLFFLMDRVTLGKTDEGRLTDTLESALEQGNDRCCLFADHLGEALQIPAEPYTIDGETWSLLRFSRQPECETCRFAFPKREPRFFSFNSPLGACPVCEGFGNLRIFDMNLIVPSPEKSLQDGAIAPWNSPSYRKKRDELLTLAPKMRIPVDVPFSELTPPQVQLLVNGSPPHKFQGLKAFFEKMQKQKYKMHIRVYLSRWRSYHQCPACHGTRIRPEARAVTLGGKNIADICNMKITDAVTFMEQLELSEAERNLIKTPLFEVKNRLRFLEQVGLGYLTLDRTMRTLSGGEQRRVGLTSALGSSLVNMLYVLDEPSVGLHPDDTDKLLESILSLRDRGNTVIVVEHEEAILRAADRIIEVGPEAGVGGGHITFEGSVAEILESEKSLTGNYLSGKRTGGIPSRHRAAEHGFLELTGACGNNLNNLSIRFPLGLLCVVTGVSGSGKSSLIQETLYPALCRKFRENGVPYGLPYDQILGTGQIDEVIMVDQSPIGRSPRSNPVTYLKIFDDIRTLFAETVDAKTRNYTTGYFSFNVDGGRCNTCHGDGSIMIDMQFLPDMYMKCPQCHGTRYQREILDITYRGRNIAEVLEMTVREAFTFFRGQAKIQLKLKRLMDVGLDYIRLGQSANTLSGGELQRLKLALHLSQTKKGHSLFILDEPTTGLHFADIVQLLDCFDALIETGHSLIVVEHNLQVIRAADYIIDIGPGAAELGGNIVVQGTPKDVAACRQSLTGRYIPFRKDSEC
ncbi:MAG: excinuclease ABC subunit UvrA [Planctomycetaceae bacterium]|jgi:excinuclease ABC subunit A|nr:excinuclease ABC subunit UvrA [Planctomycetaceae bacterium]